MKTSGEAGQVFALPFLKEVKTLQVHSKGGKKILKVYLKMETNASITWASAPVVGEKAEEPIKALISLHNEETSEGPPQGFPLEREEEEAASLLLQPSPTELQNGDIHNFINTSLISASSPGNPFSSIFWWSYYMTRLT